MAHETVKDFVNWEDVADCDKDASWELEKEAEELTDILEDKEGYLKNDSTEEYEIDGC
jgi:hypothetical protein